VKKRQTSVYVLGFRVVQNGVTKLLANIVEFLHCIDLP